MLLRTLTPSQSIRFSSGNAPTQRYSAPRFEGAADRFESENVARQATEIVALLSRDYGEGITGKEMYCLILELMIRNHNAADREHTAQLAQYDQELMAFQDRDAKRGRLSRFFAAEIPPYKPEKNPPESVCFHELYARFGRLATSHVMDGFTKNSVLEAAQAAIKDLIEGGLIYLNSLVYSNYPRELFVDGRPIPHYSGTGVLCPVGLTPLKREVVQEIVRQGGQVYQEMPWSIRIA